MTKPTKPFDIFYGKIQQAGSNIRLELRKAFRAELEKRGANLEKKSEAAIIIQEEEEYDCIVVKVLFHKRRTP